jgi:putative ABC transport system permease protein
VLIAAFMNDIRYALRQFRKSPLFTLIALTTLALGIGASTAIFTLLDQALIRSLPVSHPEQLVRLRYTGESPGHTSSFGGEDQDFFSFPMYRDLRDKNGVFNGLIADDEKYVGVQWNNRSEIAEAELVSGNYFEVLGLKPAMGRLLLPSDDVANSAPVAVLSFNYWKTKLGSDPSVIGRTLLVNTQPFTIVGVAEPGFRSIVAGETPGLFAAASAKNIITPRWQDLEDRQSHWLTIVGRLKPGEKLPQAQAGLEPLWHTIRADELKQFGYHSARTRRLFLDESHIQLLDGARGFSPLRDQIGTPLLILMGMVGLLVLMACVNISSLLLVRAAGRTREMAVRYAIGAGRWQIVRQLLLEGALLGAVGGSLGLLMAPVLCSFLLRTVFTDPMSEVPFSAHPDMRILLFNFVVAFAVSILFSLAPALRFLRPDLVSSLKQQTATATGSPLRFRRISVGAQIAVSLLLLIGAGLFVQTLHNLRSVNVGFSTDHLLSFEVHPRLAGYQADQMPALNRRILDAVAALPGVRAVGATDDPDLGGDDETCDMTVAGYVHHEGEDMSVEQPWVTPTYFSTMQVPMIAGRAFDDGDTVEHHPVAIVNAAFAKHYFRSPQDAIGRMMGVDADTKTKFDIEIVGVVGDTKHANLRDPAKRTVYRPLLQNPQMNSVTYLVRTWEDPKTAEENLRSAMQQLDSKLAISHLQTEDEQIAIDLSNERLFALLSVSFGVVAMLLAAIGLYGVLAYSTAQRTREIGIRMAMGARRSSVVQLVLQDVLWICGVSVLLTLPLALLLGRLLRQQLYGIGGGDPLTLLGGTLLVSVVALLAAMIPARRAASVEPMQALRTE